MSPCLRGDHRGADNTGIAPPNLPAGGEELGRLGKSLVPHRITHPSNWRANLPVSRHTIPPAA